MNFISICESQEITQMDTLFLILPVQGSLLQFFKVLLDNPLPIPRSADFVINSGFSCNWQTDW